MRATPMPRQSRPCPATRPRSAASPGPSPSGASCTRVTSSAAYGPMPWRTRAMRFASRPRAPSRTCRSPWRSAARRCARGRRRSASPPGEALPLMASPRGWILAGVRTPFAKAGTALRRTPSYELGRIAAAEVIARADLDPARIDEVVFGHCAMPAEAANSARVVALRAGVPERVPAVTVHRNCASGMESVANACHRIGSGDAKLVLAGGMESMSLIPLQFSFEYSDFLEGLMRAKTTFAKLGAMARFRPHMLTPRIALAEGLTDLVCGLNMGQTAEGLSREFRITREEQDAFALRSHQRAIAARERLREEIVPVYPAPGYEVVRDDVG